MCSFLCQGDEVNWYHGSTPLPLHVRFFFRFLSLLSSASARHPSAVFERRLNFLHAKLLSLFSFAFSCLDLFLCALDSLLFLSVPMIQLIGDAPSMSPLRPGGTSSSFGLFSLHVRLGVVDL